MRGGRDGGRHRRRRAEQDHLAGGDCDRARGRRRSRTRSTTSAPATCSRRRSSSRWPTAAPATEAGRVRQRGRGGADAGRWGRRRSATGAQIEAPPARRSRASLARLLRRRLRASTIVTRSAVGEIAATACARGEQQAAAHGRHLHERDARFGSDARGSPARAARRNTRPALNALPIRPTGKAPASPRLGDHRGDLSGQLAARPARRARARPHRRARRGSRSPSRTRLSPPWSAAWSRRGWRPPRRSAR